MLSTKRPPAAAFLAMSEIASACGRSNDDATAAAVAAAVVTRK